MWFDEEEICGIKDCACRSERRNRKLQKLYALYVLEVGNKWPHGCGYGHEGKYAFADDEGRCHFPAWFFSIEVVFKSMLARDCSDEKLIAMILSRFAHCVIPSLIR